MLFVIIHHFIVDDFGLRYIITFEFTRSNREKIVLLALNAIVIVGVNLFFLSSGLEYSRSICFSNVIFSAVELNRRTH